VSRDELIDAIGFENAQKLCARFGGQNHAIPKSAETLAFRRERARQLAAHLTYRQIAQAMGCSTRTVGNLLNAALTEAT